MSRQGSQMSALKFQARSNGLSAPSHRPLLIGETVLFEVSIDCLQVSALWERDQVVAASVSDQILDASFLPTGMHIGKKCLEAIDTVKVQKHVLFSAVMPFQDLQNGRLEIIVDDHPRDYPPAFEGVMLTQQKGFLPLGGEAFHKHGSRKADPSGQERDFDQLALELDGRFTKVKLCSLPRRKVERDVGRFRTLAQFLYEQTHSGFSNRNAKLAQLCPHAMSGPALFRCPTFQPLILLKPFLNVWQCSVAHRGLGLCLKRILTHTRRWSLLKQLSDGVAREPKVAGRSPPAPSLGQKPRAKFSSQGPRVNTFCILRITMSFQL